jgi:protein-S-isoprenylcysteine O-methyltransferase Ste14
MAATGTVPASHPGRDAPGVIAPPPIIYALALLVGFGLEAVLPSPELPGAMRIPLGALLLAAALPLAAAFFKAFRRAGTPVDVRKETTSLVTSGPYRLSRNPGYLSLSLLYAGIAILAAPWALLVLVAALVIVDRGVIRREERYLERRFGEEYLRYKASTRRWL